MRDQSELEVHLRSIAHFVREMLPGMRQVGPNVVADEYLWYGGGKYNHYSIYHKSFSDWLMRSVSGDVYYVDQRMGYRRLAAVALIVGPKITPQLAAKVCTGLLGMGSRAVPLLPSFAGHRCYHLDLAKHWKLSHMDGVVQWLRRADIPPTEWERFGLNLLCDVCPCSFPSDLELAECKALIYAFKPQNVYLTLCCHLVFGSQMFQSSN